MVDAVGTRARTGAIVDTVIRGGRIVDGTGAPPFVGDVAITDGRVAAVGRGGLPDHTGREEIDASGCLVTPGFVDVHTHFDAQCTWDPLLSPSGGAGVTTVIGGNCGVGFAPARRSDQMHEFVVQLMEGVEDIPAAALNEGLTWDWETFPEYLDALASREYCCDIGMFIAHGPVRAYVMGRRCNDSDRPGGPFQKPVTDGEIDQMAEVVREAVAAGALGFSTNRLGGHRDGSGVCVPGTLGSAYEYTQLCRGAAAGGGGIAQFVSDFASYDDIPRAEMDPAKQQRRAEQDWDILQFVSAEYGLRCLLSMGLSNDGPSAYNTIANVRARMSEIQEAGGEITTQTFARPQALLTSW
jgi:N-acyl-D-amino-acid deacylase